MCISLSGPTLCTPWRVYFLLCISSVNFSVGCINGRPQHCPHLCFTEAPSSHIRNSGLTLSLVLTSARPPLSLAPVQWGSSQHSMPGLNSFHLGDGVRSWSDGPAAFSPHWDWLLSSVLCTQWLCKMTLSGYTLRRFQWLALAGP